MTGDIIQRPCSIWEGSAQYIVFPVGENVRTYANGDIRFIHLNTYGEPAAGASHVMVTYRNPSEFSFTCSVLSPSEDVGFSNVDLLMAKSAYDPKTGLTAFIPVRIFDGLAFVDRTLVVTVNQGKGMIKAEIRE